MMISSLYEKLPNVYIAMLFVSDLVNVSSWAMSLMIQTRIAVCPQELMRLPTISGSIEVWDFLSVDSQVQYFFLLLWFG